MEKQRQPLSTKKPPIPFSDHQIIEDWMANRIMPGIHPLIKEIDNLILASVPELHFAIKWGNAYYGTRALGWIIEVAAYDVSANVVFLSGVTFDPQPPMGTGAQTRYIKLRSVAELRESPLMDFVTQAAKTVGWK